MFAVYRDWLWNKRGGRSCLFFLLLVLKQSPTPDYGLWLWLSEETHYDPSCRHLKTVDTIRFHPTQRFKVAVQVCLRNKQSVKVTTGAYVVQHSGRLRSFFRLSTRGSWTKRTFGTVEQTLTTKVLGLLEIAICVVALVTWERIGVKANINGMPWFRFCTKESLLLVSRNVNNGLELLDVCAKWVKV